MNNNTKALMKAVKLCEKDAGEKGYFSPSFHLSPPTGWMNDPNGLSEFNGKHHIFFQYSPFFSCPGMNYWGHFATENFVDFEYLEPAICCDQNFDCHGVYSGSALIENGKMTIFYTGNVKYCGNYDYIYSGREHNTIYVESDDGINFGEKNLLMINSDYPRGVSCHVRDPKVWKNGEKYYMILGARTKKDRGECLLYTSTDKENWELANCIRSKKSFGYMWECPDYFEIGKEKFLSACPQGVKAEGYRYNNIYQSGYFKVDGDIESDYNLKQFTEYDCGFDFYAPQTYLDSKNRRIMIGWMGLPDSPYKNPDDKWFQCLTLPCELSADNNGNICRYPIEEINSLHTDEKSETIANSDYISPKFMTCDAIIKYNSNPDKIFINIKRDISLNYSDNILTLSLGQSGMGRSKRSCGISNISEIRILCDTSCIEIFINKGEKVFSTRYCDPNPIGEIASTKFNGEVEFHHMKSINIVNKNK